MRHLHDHDNLNGLMQNTSPDNTLLSDPVPDLRKA
jgi:hypothetical protein